MALTDLSKERIHAQLRSARYGRSISIVESTGSTNDDARLAAQAGAADGHVIVADTQLAGRGSRGRTWVSPAGSDLYLSIVARVKVSLAELPPLTLAVGLGVADTVDAFLPAGVRAAVKWPNDTWVQRQKCAGILVEGASLGEQVQPLVIGIGINVNRTTFPSDLDTPATSIALSRGRPVDRAQVLVALLDAVEMWVDRFVNDGVERLVQAVEPRLAMRGERAQCDGVIGVVEGISRAGALRMRTDWGVREVVSGTLRPLA